MLVSSMTTVIAVTNINFYGINFYGINFCGNNFCGKNSLVTNSQGAQLDGWMEDISLISGLPWYWLVSMTGRKIPARQ
jgi:hypothetical protein